MVGLMHNTMEKILGNGNKLIKAGFRAGTLQYSTIQYIDMGVGRVSRAWDV